MGVRNTSFTVNSVSAYFSDALFFLGDFAIVTVYSSHDSHNENEIIDMNMNPNNAFH